MGFFRNFINLVWPRTGDHHVLRGIAAVRRQDFDEAIAALRIGLGMKLKKYERDFVLTLLGNAYCELNQFDDSVNAYLQALELNRRAHQIWVNLGVAHRYAGRLEYAQRCYSKALTLKPDYAEAHSSLGVLLVVRDPPAEAINSFEHAEKLDGTVATIPANLAIALGMVGRHHDALGALNRAEKLGYPRGRAIRRRLEELADADADFEPTDIGKYHLGCPQCHCEVHSHPDEDDTGRPIPCPDCGAPMKILGPS